MKPDSIDRLLDSAYPDPDGGPVLDIQVRSVAIEDSLDGREVELVRALGLGDKLAVVSDPDTREALGARVERALSSAFRVQSLGLRRCPRADEDTLIAIEAALEPDTDALVAVGSGTINDLCKMAAARQGKPYAVFGTAPSMNGYASVSASISFGGFKQSVPARAPAGVFLDLGVLSRAPARLIRGGLGDCLCRPTAQADWLLAHLVLGEPYRKAPFVLLATQEEELFAHSDALVAGDLEIMGHLARTLVLSGIGMTISGGSHPASQGEHLITHYMEMTRTADEPVSYHGEQIGVSALVMADLQQRVLGMDTPPVLGPTTVSKDDVLARLGPERGEQSWRELEEKRITADRARELNAMLGESWGWMRERLSRVTRSPQELRRILERAGAPTAPQHLGWPMERFREACEHAREIRNRYTFLDLAGDSGVPVLGPDYPFLSK